MAPEVYSLTPNLASYLKALKTYPADSALDQLILLLRRRQVQHSRNCAIAATHLYVKVIADSRFQNSAELLERVRQVGRRLQAASPHELVLGNITRRVLGLIREVNEGPASKAVPKSERRGKFDYLFQKKPASEPLPVTDIISVRDLREDVLNGMREMIDELDQADEQIAGYALEHIRPKETILTYTSSLTVQKFLLNVVKKRKLTVIQVDGYPNEHKSTIDTITNGRLTKDAQDPQGRVKSLIAAGATVIVIPDSAVFAVMSQVTKVLLPINVGFPTGGFVGAAGCSIIARAARAHSVPVVALGAVYKLTPVYPEDTDALVELGDSKKVISYKDGGFSEQIDILNPVSEYVGPELVNMFITNIGSHSPANLGRIVADHYRAQDLIV